MEKNLVDQVSNYLRDQIISLRIKPGEQLNESLLIDKIGVSRAPLREAFRLLEGEGLITRYSGKGVFVREITATDILELFPIRAVLESLAAEMAAPRLTDMELDNIRKINEKMEQAIQDGNKRLCVRLNYDFHKKIVKAANNRKLEEMIRSVGRQSMWYIFAALYYSKAQDYAMASHKDIYSALKKRDGKQAGECIKNHINQGGFKILEYFPLKG